MHFPKPSAPSRASRRCDAERGCPKSSLLRFIFQHRPMPTQGLPSGTHPSHGGEHIPRDQNREIQATGYPTPGGTPLNRFRSPASSLTCECAQMTRAPRQLLPKSRGFPSVSASRIQVFGDRKPSGLDPITQRTSSATGLLKPWLLTTGFCKT
jgi:hypothetical protein